MQPPAHCIPMSSNWHHPPIKGGLWTKMASASRQHDDTPVFNGMKQHRQGQKHP